MYNDRSWLFSIFAIVSLFAGSSFLFIDDAADSRMIHLTELTDTDIEMILAVKADMSAAKVQTYESVALNN